MWCDLNVTKRLISVLAADPHPTLKYLDVATNLIDEY